MVIEYANYLQSRGHEVEVVTNVVKTIFGLRVKVRELSKTKNKLASIISAITKKRESDLVIATIIVMALFLSVRNKKKVVYFAQDYDAEYYKNPLMKMLIRAIYYHCLTIRKMPVIAVSEQLADFFSDTFKTYVNAVNNGVDLSAFYRDRKRDYLNMKGSSHVILLFSRSDYRKGYDIALNVISRFSEDIENKVVTLWSVGEKIDTPYEITQFGTVSPDDLRAILSCSDVFLYPSRHEGFGLLPLEAIACGCPVVTSDRVPSVKDGAGAIIRPYDDIDGFAQSIRSLLYDEALKCDLMQKGSEFVKQHSIAKSRQRFEQEILSIHSQMASQRQNMYRRNRVL